MNTVPFDIDPSLRQVLDELALRFPDTPFLTLGQTVLWDEPTKAAFCRALEVAAPNTRMVAGVHDTDYFAKLPHIGEKNDQPFVLRPHNDGSTRGLWSAAGEMSCLFGAETVPTRAVLTHNGVAFDRVARRFPGGESALLDEETNAWGWRAVVHTQDAPLIAADVKLNQIAPALREQLKWAFETSRACLGSQSTLDAPSKISSWIEDFLQATPDGTLSDLYGDLTPKLWSLARGGGSCSLETTSSMELFRFNTQTCFTDRWKLLDAFLNPETRDVARRCYDQALKNSGIYTLDAFGPGAVPFDVVLPGRGRGTLRLHEGSLYIQTEPPATLCLDCDCSSVADLAVILEDQYGPNVAIVGKAVALISMLATEFIFVFHEKASSYTSRTQEMNRCLREAGIEISMRPMLRLRLNTWDALENVEAQFQLPPHLARAFGRAEISAQEFAHEWQQACSDADSWRERLKGCASPRDLLQALAERDARWSEEAEKYHVARRAVRESRDKTTELEARIEALKARGREATERSIELEKQKGQDWRERVQPLRVRLFDIKEAQNARLNPVDADGKPRRLSKEERRLQNEQIEQEEQEISELRERVAWLVKERGHFGEEIESLRREASECRAQNKALTREKLAMERSEAVRSARADVSRIEYEAELERLRQVRDAFMASEALKQANLRPTSWWFPLVSPDGTWFDALSRGVQARIEEL